MVPQWMNSEIGSGKRLLRKLLGILANKPMMLKNIKGTQIQWIILFVEFWWLSPYSSNHSFKVLIFLALSGLFGKFFYH